MSNDEQIQIQKDTVWQIHLLQKRIVCLERRIESYVDSMRRTVSNWDSDVLNLSQYADGIEDHLDDLPEPKTFAKHVRDLKNAKDELKRLEDALSRM